MKTDPVCGMQVDEKDAIVSHKGAKTEYFCSEECKEKFEENPNQYEKKSA
jgi:YHS domain-containing protein